MYKMWIRKILLVLMLILIPTSFFSFRHYKVYKKRVEYIDEYVKIRVKVDSIDDFAMNGGVRDGNVKHIYYNNYLSLVTVDEDAKNDLYKHFIKSKKDSIYIWHNPNADDRYTTKTGKPLNLKRQKRKMYFNLSIMVLTVLLILWFIYIMFIEKDMDSGNEDV